MVLDTRAGTVVRKHVSKELKPDRLQQLGLQPPPGYTRWFQQRDTALHVRFPGQDLGTSHAAEETDEANTSSTDGALGASRCHPRPPGACILSEAIKKNQETISKSKRPIQSCGNMHLDT